jgi:hypothetical protein
MAPVLSYITSHILVNVILKLKNRTIQANTGNISHHKKTERTTMTELCTVSHPAAPVLHLH